MELASEPDSKVNCHTTFFSVVRAAQSTNHFHLKTMSVFINCEGLGTLTDKKLVATCQRDSLNSCAADVSESPRTLACNVDSDCENNEADVGLHNILRPPVLEKRILKHGAKCELDTFSGPVDTTNAAACDACLHPESDQHRLLCDGSPNRLTNDEDVCSSNVHVTSFMLSRRGVPTRDDGSCNLSLSPNHSFPENTEADALPYAEHPRDCSDTTCKFCSETETTKEISDVADFSGTLNKSCSNDVSCKSRIDNISWQVAENSDLQKQVADIQSENVHSRATEEYAVYGFVSRRQKILPAQVTDNTETQSREDATRASTEFCKTERRSSVWMTDETPDLTHFQKAHTSHHFRKGSAAVYRRMLMDIPDTRGALGVVGAKRDGECESINTKDHAAFDFVQRMHSSLIVPANPFSLSQIVYGPSSELWRLTTFAPLSLRVSKLRLAKSGFYYLHDRDDIRCFSCGASKRQWDRAERDVRGFHHPDCAQVHGGDKRNVPIDDPSDIQSDSRHQFYQSCETPETASLILPRPQEDKEHVARHREYAAESSGTAVPASSVSPLISQLGASPETIHLLVGSSQPVTFTTTQVPSVRNAGHTEKYLRFPVQVTQSEPSLPQQPSLSQALRSSNSEGHDDLDLGEGGRLVDALLHQLDVHQAASPANATVVARLLSFADWQKHSFQSPLSLALAGFYFVGHGDSVQCWWCGVTLRGWRTSDDPWVTHAVFRVSCDYVTFAKGQNFVIQALSGRGQENSPLTQNEFPLSDTPAYDTTSTGIPAPITGSLQSQVMSDTCRGDPVTVPSVQWQGQLDPVIVSGARDLTDSDNDENRSRPGQALNSSNGGNNADSFDDRDGATICYDTNTTPDVSSGDVCGGAGINTNRNSFGNSSSFTTPPSEITVSCESSRSASCSSGPRAYCQETEVFNRESALGSRNSEEDDDGRSAYDSGIGSASSSEEPLSGSKQHEAHCEDVTNVPHGVSESSNIESNRRADAIASQVDTSDRTHADVLKCTDSSDTGSGSTDNNFAKQSTGNTTAENEISSAFNNPMVEVEANGENEKLLSLTTVHTSGGEPEKSASHKGKRRQHSAESVDTVQSASKDPGCTMLDGGGAATVMSSSSSGKSASVSAPLSSELYSASCSSGKPADSKKENSSGGILSKLRKTRLFKKTKRPSNSDEAHEKPSSQTGQSKAASGACSSAQSLEVTAPRPKSDATPENHKARYERKDSQISHKMALSSSSERAKNIRETSNATSKSRTTHADNVSNQRTTSRRASQDLQIDSDGGNLASEEATVSQISELTPGERPVFASPKKSPRSTESRSMLRSDSEHSESSSHWNNSSTNTQQHNVRSSEPSGLRTTSNTPQITQQQKTSGLGHTSATETRSLQFATYSVQHPFVQKNLTLSETSRHTPSPDTLQTTQYQNTTGSEHNSAVDRAGRPLYAASSHTQHPPQQQGSASSEPSRDTPAPRTQPMIQQQGSTISDRTGCRPISNPPPRRTMEPADLTRYYHRLLEENQRLRARRTCRICRSQNVDTIFLPCGHICACDPCAATIRECCLCFQRIRGTAHVYFD